MSALAFGIAAAASAALAGISLAAKSKLPGREKMPMQWGWDGKVTWSAPRLVGLFFTPAVGVLALFTAAALLDGTPERQATTVGLIGLALITVHVFHLSRVRKHGAA